MKIEEKIQIVKDNLNKLTDGQKKAFGCYKSMLRNIAEEDDRLGGESHVSPDGIKQFDAFLDKCITQNRCGSHCDNG